MLEKTDVEAGYSSDFRAAILGCDTAPVSFDIDPVYFHHLILITSIKYFYCLLRANLNFKNVNTDNFYKAL